MRYLIQGLTLAGLLLLAGCSNVNPRPKPPSSRQSRWDGQPTAPSMVAYLSENARLLPALTCEDLTLDCRQGKESAAPSCIPQLRVNCR